MEKLFSLFSNKEQENAILSKSLSSSLIIIECCPINT